ncbi:MAG TPA: hypothetical protein VG796_21345 [Verrucomicrobiales bacterium]|nr:hypothetical protein [Verrucomicrobiales bacterium]
MSLCKLLPLWVIVGIAAGACIGRFTSVGTLNGLVWGFCIGSAPIWGMVLICIWINIVGDHPRCRCGKRRNSDFDSLDFSLSEPRWFDYRCQGCGRHYRHRQGVCYEIDSTGAGIPYMMQRGLLPWRRLRS